MHTAPQLYLESLSHSVNRNALSVLMIITLDADIARVERSGVDSIGRRSQLPTLSSKASLHSKHFSDAARTHQSLCCITNNVMRLTPIYLPQSAILVFIKRASIVCVKTKITQRDFDWRKNCNNCALFTAHYKLN